MSSTRERRIAKELADIHNDRDNSGVYAEPLDPANLMHLKGTFPAPPDTPYAGGKYEVDIQIPDMYPFKPPVIKFITKMWHPNISSQTGAICLDTLGTGWSPVGTIKMALMSLRMLLESPNPKDPQDAEVARMMLDDPEYCEVMAHDWAVRHAGAPRCYPTPPEFKRLRLQQRPAGGDSTFAQGAGGPKKGGVSDVSRLQGYNRNLVERFVVMGFDIDAVVEAFNYVGIDRNGGEDYELEEAYMGDITARLLGEQ